MIIWSKLNFVHTTVNLFANLLVPHSLSSLLVCFEHVSNVVKDFG